VLFGDTTIERGVERNAEPSVSFFAFVDRRTGMARSISVYLAASNTARKILVGLYAGTDAGPRSLVSAGSMRSPKAGRWNTISIRPALVKAGHAYWVAALAHTGTLSISSTGHACTSIRLGNGWPAPTQALARCRVSVYVSGTPSVTHEPVQTTTGTTTLPIPPVLPPTPPVLPLPPINTGAPAVSGTAQEGQSVSATIGSWSNSPTSYSYQWEGCSSSCSDISGATSPSYILQPSDVGNTVEVVVTAANDGGSGSATSGTTQKVNPKAPVNTAAPTITGTPQQGQTLAASTGSWSHKPTSYSYQWQHCSSSCSDISGATSSGYTLQSSDVGDRVDVSVTAWNSGGSASAMSNTTAAVMPLAPVNTAAPTVSGTAQQGRTLSTTNGSWSNSPTSYSYQWQDCSGLVCTSIVGATGSSYTLQSLDVGDTIDVVVTAANAGGSGSASSSKTAAVKPLAPVNTAAPSVSGTARQGLALSTTNGSWSNSPTSYSYQWQDCLGLVCTSIGGATGSSYTLQSLDVGDTIDVVVTATNAGGSGSATSSKTGTVTASTQAAPVNTAAPTVSGTAQQGQTLSTTNGSWSNGPTSYSYQWQDCSGSVCTSIGGATGSSYTLQSSDVGDTVDVIVTATNAGGSGSATSSKTAAVKPLAPVNTAAPTVSGTAQQGLALSTTNGSWSNSPTSYSYQWQDCSGSVCTSIVGATGSSYTLQSLDVGDTIDVVVTATNAGGSGSATSSKTGTVTASTQAAPVNTAAPTITGTAQQGQTLSATNGSWSNNPTSYSYQWQDCLGLVCTSIGGARGSSYTLQSSDVGDTIDVVVTATNAGGSASQTSGRTGVVTSPFSPLHVSGNQLENQSNIPVFMHGMNRAGTEYSCSSGTGFFDGTGSNFTEEDAQITAMAAWGINAEMITLNEDCWLGINGVSAGYSDSNGAPVPGCSASQCPYANAIENLVQTDEANGIYPVISLFALAPGATKSTTHDTLLDNDHAPLFWEEVANFFRNDPYVVFRPEQEPTLGNGSESDWQCWSQGDVSYSTSSDNPPPTAPTSTGSPDMCQSKGLSTYQTVGMQSAVNIIRGAGATNIIMLPGLGYANMWACGPTTAPSMCGALDASSPPVTDPHSPAQLMGEADVYPTGNTCGNITCYNDTYLPIAQSMPFVAGETAENPAGGYAPTTAVDTFLSWIDSHANGYFPYAWDPWAGIIGGYGDNTSPYQAVWGADYYDHIHGIAAPPLTQPTDGIRFVQDITTPCTLGQSNGGSFSGGPTTLSVPGAVDSGDTLIAIFAGQGYTTAAPQITGVSDGANGSWTEIGSSTGGSQASGSLNVSYEVFDVPSSAAAAGGLTLTVSGTAGGSNSSQPSAVVLDLRGVASIGASSFQSGINAPSGTFTGPTLSGVPSGDLVLGVWGAYSGSTGNNLAVSPPWNTQVIDLWTGSINCPLAGATWDQVAATGSVTPTAGDAGNLAYYGGALDLHP
jgi:hypothetical protein